MEVEGPSDEDVDYGKPLSVGGEWSPEKETPQKSPKGDAGGFKGSGAGSKPEFEL